MADTAERVGPVAVEATYDAFVSYSHAADGLLAPRLQSALQRFAKPWWKRRAMRIFRDESSLSANPHLWSSIAEAFGSPRFRSHPFSTVGAHATSMCTCAAHALR